MAKFTNYTPRSVFLPPKIARKHADVLRHPVDSHPADLAMDEYVLFHDVFRTVDDSKIVAIGTAWRDMKRVAKFDPAIKSWQMGWQKSDLHKLKDTFTPTSITHNGKPLAVRYQTKYGLIGQKAVQSYEPIFGLYEIEMTPAMQKLTEVPLKITWRDFEYELKIPRSCFKLAQTDITLSAVQRDSHPDWVGDWCRYYHRQHGIKRIVFYNNLDDNRAAIIKTLQALPDELEIFYIEWPYRFTYEVHINTAQPAQMNHCLLMFGGRSRFMMNFDIDEYLVNNTKHKLVDYLRAKMNTTRRTATLAIRQWAVPDLRDAKQAAKPARVWDFEHCVSGLNPASPKLINDCARVEVLMLHRTMPRWSCGRFLLKNRWIWLFLEFLHLYLPYFRYTLPIIPKRMPIFFVAKWLATKPIIGGVVRLLLRRFTNALNVPRELYFYHYAAIGTNWNKSLPDKRPVFNEKLHALMPHPIKKSQIYDE